MGARSLVFAGALAAALVAGACKDDKSGVVVINVDTSSTAPMPSSAPTAAPTASIDPNGPIDTIPVPQSKVADVVNPKHEAKYAGASGTLHGVIRMEGDPAPTASVVIPGNCGEAEAIYGKLFRVGQDKTLGDALVAVTFGHGYVPAREPVETLTIHGCALNTRTVAVTYGQRIDILNKEENTATYMPYLNGGTASSVLVAVPQGDPVHLYPVEPKAHYAIQDQLPHPFLYADVFVLAYPTHAVTGLDGHYKIIDIPVGHAKVNAFLPSINKVVEQDIDIKEGDNTLDLTMKFDKTKDRPGGAPPSASASASPAVPPGPPKKK